MESSNAEINHCHSAFCAAMAIDEADLPLGAVLERQWYSAIKEGVTPDMVKLVVFHRRKRIAAGVRHEESLRLRNLIGSEERIAELIEDAAAVKAGLRATPKAKIEVLRATGRDCDGKPSRAVGEIIAAMKKAAR